MSTDKTENKENLTNKNVKSDTTASDASSAQEQNVVEIPSLNSQVIDELSERENAKAELAVLTAQYNELLEKTETTLKNYDEVNGKYLRLRAEFDNYKRRTQTEREQDFKYASENFLKKLVPVVDDFDRSMAYSASGAEPVKLAEGIKLVYEKLNKVLADEGVKKFESLNKPFNVEYHIALMKQPDASKPAETVIQEFLAGYLYKDKILRHAQVVVSEAVAIEAHQEDGSDSESPNAEVSK